MRLLVFACCAAAGAVFADVAWPADFAEQVAANHPAPSGTQIAADASAATPLAVVEGRSTTAEISEELSVDIWRPSGCVLILK